MMNPEFKRNLWLSFTTHRLIATPALLGLVFLAVARMNPDSPANDLYHWASTLFILITWIWGGANASASIIDELREKTWDQQRMSALDPWTMTWGKLFGATLFNWYGGLICLLVMLASGIASNQPDWMLDMLILIAVGILIHATMIMSNLYAAKFDLRLVRRGGTAWVMLLVFAYPLQSIMMSRGASNLVWWGMTIGSERFFLLASVLLFMGCAIVAAWRLMSNALQIRTLPWALPLFVLILAVYCSGFAQEKYFSFIGVTIATGFCYATLLTESNSLLVWNKLRLRWQTGDWRSALADMPLWPMLFLLALLFAASVPLTWVDDFRFPIITGGALTPLVMVLMLLRDAGIVLFFSFAPNARRPVAVALLYIVVLSVLLPILFMALELNSIAYFFMPYVWAFAREEGSYSDFTSLPIAGIQAAFALGLVAWRFNKIRRLAV